MARKNKQKPLVDEQNYSVVCGGIRRASLTQAAALAYAEKLANTWAEIGFTGRKVEVFYRDGSLVAIRVS